jgi:hypothetical protein
VTEKTLEFRGIPRSHLLEYATELGGIQTSDSFPIQIEGESWTISLLREEEVKITSRFKVNAVFIQFQAISDDKIDELITRYRTKTTRVGG